MKDLAVEPVETPARLLWVGQRGSAGESGGGDVVYDRKVVAELRAAGSTVEVLHPAPVPRATEVLNLARGIPFMRARFWTEPNRRLVRKASAAADLTLVSWEALDFLASSASSPAVVILHNVTSDALPQYYPRNPAAPLLARRVLSWERRLYRHGGLAGAAVVSERDAGLLRRIAPDLPICLVSPGMPRPQPLSPTAPLLREIVLSGTYDWRPKGRDVTALAREIGGQGFPVWYDAHLPDEVTWRLQPRRLTDDTPQGLRFGIIADRFQSGHKLKSTAYLAANCAVLSFADVSQDFAGLPDATFFIRHVTGLADIRAAMDELAAHDPERLIQRFLRFRAAVAERFSWQGSTRHLLEFCGEILGDARLRRPRACSKAMT